MNTEYKVTTAGSGDTELLSRLMEEFYAESDSPFDPRNSRRAFSQLLGHEGHGRVFLLTRSDDPVGYLVLTLGFSMEYGGRDAFIDDLFILKEHRAKGLGKTLMNRALETCRKEGVRAVHLEVGRDNLVAKDLYAKLGFRDNDRQLLTCRLTEKREV